MKKIFTLVTILCLALIGCQKREPLVYKINKSDELKQYESELAAESQFAASREKQSIEASIAEASEAAAMEAKTWKKKEISRERVKVKGIYLTDATAGSSRMEDIISHIDETELNAVVIDIKNDRGQIAFPAESPEVQELASQTDTIPDLPGLISKLHEHGIYAIARLVTFRDPYLATVRPEWMNTKSDGSLFYDNSGMAWVNPYKKEYWEYLAEVADDCADAGFDEVQFDYVRFCTEQGMKDVVYTEDDTQGRSKTDIITEFMQYISDRAAEKNIFVSADVFGTIIGSYVDAAAVGQDYPVMASCVDYMCPMIYPSHYGDGNFGIEHPDTDPYGSISGALNASRKSLTLNQSEGIHQAIVRPWLQAFTASWLPYHINYGAKEIRQEIKAVYDQGYEEWILWNAANDYNWDAFLASSEH
ncbi:putative glycoside hydrolase [Oribacterium sp. HCP28S3_H8]|uniref:putative glycoside hydrolase n=1 Tax=Oribacterium sp. HCP28S3_H8 TaxID=3438945 RepID=UPI003F8A8FB4